jgi:3-oxoacyl-[acyl-carrier protein] reductase
MASSSTAEAAKTPERVAWVTGSSRGIGAAIAERLAQDGYSLALHGSREGSADEVAARLADKYGIETLVTSGDVSDAAAVTALARQVFEKFRRLDALVVNAGAHEAGMLGMMPAAAVEKLFAVNAVGAVHTLQAVTRLLRRGSAPAVVLLSSVMATDGVPGQAVYAASKGAIVALTTAAAKELGPAGIRVNAVAPGFIRTDMLASLDEKGREERVASTPLGRLGEPEDVADVVAFLLGEQSRFVTGQVIGVDGGVVV